MLALGMIALVVASFILTYSVVSRYLFKAATDWQDEAAVFCIVGTVFLCGAYVQAGRGHVGIEALASLLSPAVNRMRMIVVDAALAPVLRLFRVEVVDAVARGVGRQDDDLVDLGAAAGHSLRADVGRHDAAGAAAAAAACLAHFGTAPSRR